MREELLHAYAPRSGGPLGTAMRALARFARRVPRRELFVRPRFRGDLEAEAHNEWTLCLWAHHEGKRVSEKTGKPLKAGSIEQRVSLAKGLLSHRFGFQLAGEAPRLKSLLRQIKLRRGGTQQRAKRRGWRWRHSKKVWRRHPEVRSSARKARAEWAAVTTATQVLARGGELAAVARGDLTFHTSHGRRYARLMIRPLKKAGGPTQPKVPQYIAEQSPEDADAPDAYAALRRLAELDCWGGESEPLFSTARGVLMTTSRYRALVKRYAAMLGFDAKLFGAHSTRIGGATDLVASGEGSELLLEAKGRWGSDIGKIYARQTRKAHLAASDAMYRARGRDLEEILPAYVQAA